MVPYGSIYQSYTDMAQSSDPSGVVKPNWVLMGLRRNLDLARQDLTGLDGSLDCAGLLHDG